MSIDVFPATVLNATLWNGESLPLSVTGGGTGATTAAQARTNLGLGTMATQNAASVAITGGSATGLSGFSVNNGVDAYIGGLRIGSTTVPTVPGQLEASGPVRFNSTTTLPLKVIYNKASYNGLEMQGTGSDTAPQSALAFFNMSNGYVGGILTNATTTAYNTTSDVRLKHAITALTGALDAIAALRPVAFRWVADDSQGHGFLAHELQQVIADAVSGEPDAVNEDGSVKPQQVDHSKLVPWLTAALQETLAQVQALTARVGSLEQQLGV